MSEYIIRSFTNIGTEQFTVPNNVYNIEYLVVGGGGGGGGGYDTGGGGGGGGMVKSGLLEVQPGQDISVVVGKGGNRSVTNYGTTYETNGGDGEQSSFGDIISLGGKGGLASRPGGGNGGLKQTELNAPTGGNGGGSASVTSLTRGYGGGGGGSLNNGSSGIIGTEGVGGLGILSNISGTEIRYGNGGNGAKGNTKVVGIDASNNTGNGGSGGAYISGGSNTGGAGGSGIIIIKYKEEIRQVEVQLPGFVPLRRYIRMFGIDTKKNQRKGHPRGLHTSYSSLGNRRR